MLKGHLPDQLPIAPYRIEIKLVVLLELFYEVVSMFPGPLNVRNSPVLSPFRPWPMIVNSSTLRRSVVYRRSHVAIR